MTRFKPVYGISIVLLLSAAILVADYALDHGFDKGSYERVSSDRSGQVRLDVSDLGVRQVRFFRFLNAGNQEVKFLVGRDPAGEIQVAFDANEICYKKRRGYRHEDEWVVCNWCDKAFRLAEVNNGGGGCKPVPLVHRLDGDQLVLLESDILAGWRLFR